MIIFIDESGDAGFKTSRGSSPHFVIVMVIFDDELDAEETAVMIKRLRKSLHKSDSFEFKFNKCNRELRVAFLSEIKSCRFRVRAIVFEKDAIYSSYLRDNKESFYSFSLRQVLEHNENTIKDAKIRLDGFGEKAFQRQLTTYLRKHLNSNTKKVMKNLRFKDSKKDVLIQMADMIAGSLRRQYDKNTKDYDVYRKIIKSKEEDTWLFK